MTSQGTAPDGTSCLMLSATLAHLTEPSYEPHQWRLLQPYLQIITG
jgi:hypothetical protein